MSAHPDQGWLLTSLGGSKPPEPDFRSTAVAEGDAFLLCSDGLWETILPEEMLVAFTVDDLDFAARRLVEVAVERGGEKGDNVSVVLVRLGHTRQTGSPVAGKLPSLSRLYRSKYSKAGL